MPSLPVEASVNPSTSKPFSSVSSPPSSADRQSGPPDPVETDTSASANKTAAASVKDLTPALPVATSTTSVGTGQNMLGVETNTDNKGNVEMDKSHLHVETLNNNKGTSQVETTADKGVTLHVHVETPEDVSPNTNSVVSADTQKPVQELAQINHLYYLPNLLNS